MRTVGQNTKICHLLRNTLALISEIYTYILLQLTSFEPTKIKVFSENFCRQWIRSVVKLRSKSRSQMSEVIIRL